MAGGAALVAQHKNMPVLHARKKPQPVAAEFFFQSRDVTSDSGVTEFEFPSRTTETRCFGDC